MLEVYRGYNLYYDDTGFYYYRGTPPTRWYFISIEDMKTDIDIWLDY